MHRARAARSRGFDSLPSRSDVGTLSFWWILPFCKARLGLLSCVLFQAEGSKQQHSSKAKSFNVRNFLVAKNTVLPVVQLYVYLNLVGLWCFLSKLKCSLVSRAVRLASVYSCVHQCTLHCTAVLVHYLYSLYSCSIVLLNLNLVHSGWGPDLVHYTKFSTYP
jgi:hypothetical protein